MPGKPSAPTFVAAALLVFLALARGGGAAALLAGGRATLPGTNATHGAMVWVALGLLLVAGLACLSAGWLLLGRRGAVTMCLVTLAVFIAGGLANGVILFGAPKAQGVLLNLGYAAAVTAAVLWARRAR